MSPPHEYAFTHDELLNIIGSPDGFIKNGQVDGVEGIKYDFHFSGRFLKARYGRELNVKDFPLDVEATSVEAGETVFVLTEELLDLPNDIKAELSNKRKLAHEGVQILGGFCVDPNYKGPLVFGVYNFSSEPFPLIKGKKIIAAQFYRLSEEEQGEGEYPKPNPIEGFPRDVIARIGRFHGISNQALEKRVEELSTVVHGLRDDFERRQDWFLKFERSIDEINKALKSLDEIIGGNLKREIEERQRGQDQLSRLLRETRERADRHDLLLKFLGFIVGGVVVAVIAYYVIRLISASTATPAP